MDIEYFIEQYPFLTDMTSAYKEFNRTVNEDERYLLSSYLNKLQNVAEYKVKHKDIYENIMRNFWLFRNKYQQKSNIYCTYLFQWLDIIKKKHVVSDYMIGIIYGVYTQNFVTPGEKNHCPYFSYDAICKEPINIIKLKNFYDNINIIESTLRNSNSLISSAGHRYVCECVDIYISTKQEYCSLEEDKNGKNKSICDILDTFESTYNNFLFNKEGINDKIPSLDAAGNVNYPRCSAENQEIRLKEEPKEELMSGAGARTVTEPESSFIPTDESGSSTPFSKTSAVSTLAGIPFFLALIYKFTPVGTLFRSKNKKSINAFNSLDEEIEKELFYLRPQNADINTIQATYNVAYGSVGN
ncbi:PIR protein [Plasmodium vivax]|uniref:VIR protein n=1 Tax=Plasmodium vivax TaxID=5855 RepID=A0A565A630_PLAVI|nr:PIR protein [Plasmodium vivax]